MVGWNLPPLVGMLGAAPVGVATGLQSKLGSARAAIGEAVARFKRLASARLLRMLDIEGILVVGVVLFWQKRSRDVFMKKKKKKKGCSRRSKWCAIW